MNLVFVSPHLKSIGETYVLPRLCRSVDGNSKCQLFLFNVAGEWDFLRGTEVKLIENPMRWIVRLAPNLEGISPWWNYRVWLFFVSMSIASGLPMALRAHPHSIVVARMATSAVALAARFTTRCKFVASMAGVPLPSALRSATWPWLYRSYSLIVVPVREMLPLVCSVTSRKASECRVIPNAVLDKQSSLQTFDAQKRTSIERSEDFRLLFVGRLTNQKGVDLLVKALKELGPTFSLSLVGDGELKDEIDALTRKLGVTDQVRFCGFSSVPWNYAADHDVYVMPSRWEGPGHTIIEALSFGMPSIVSDCPSGPAESVEYGRFGMVFSTNEVSSLAEKINEARENYSDLVQAAKMGMSESIKYTPESVLREWEKIVDEIGSYSILE